MFAVQQPPVQGTRGGYRVNLRHGVSRVRSGSATRSASSFTTPASRAGQEELFESGVAQAAGREQLEPGAFVLRQFAWDEAPALLDAIQAVARMAPFRRMTTRTRPRPAHVGRDDELRRCRLAERPLRLSLRRDRSGDEAALAGHARRFRAARPACRKRGGLEGLAPDACLINRYEPGTN